MHAPLADVVGAYVFVAVALGSGAWIGGTLYPSFAYLQSEIAAQRGRRVTVDLSAWRWTFIDDAYAVLQFLHAGLLGLAVFFMWRGLADDALALELSASVVFLVVALVVGRYLWAPLSRAYVHVIGALQAAALLSLLALAAAQTGVVRAERDNAIVAVVLLSVTIILFCAVWFMLDKSARVLARQNG
mgnify:CR=1 FL=1